MLSTATPPATPLGIIVLFGAGHLPSLYPPYQHGYKCLRLPQWKSVPSASELHERQRLLSVNQYNMYGADRRDWL